MGVTNLGVTGAYATIANGGVYLEPSSTLKFLTTMAMYYLTRPIRRTHVL